MHQGTHKWKHWETSKLAWTGFKDANTVSCTWRSQECMKTLTSPSCSNTCVRKGRNNHDAIERSLCDSKSGLRQKLLGMAICMLLLRFEQFDQRTKGPIWPKFSRQQLRSCSFWSQELLVPFSSLNCHHQHLLKIALDITLKLKSWNPHTSCPQYSSPSKLPKNQVWNPWPTTTSTQMQ